MSSHLSCGEHGPKGRLGRVAEGLKQTRRMKPMKGKCGEAAVEDAGGGLVGSCPERNDGWASRQFTCKCDWTTRGNKANRNSGGEDAYALQHFA